MLHQRIHVKDVKKKKPKQTNLHETEIKAHDCE